MARAKLSDRRASVTIRVDHAWAGGNEVSVLVTLGYDPLGNVREVFSADFKSGTDLYFIITDACILLSRLLQHGDTPAEIAASMCSPASLIGTIAAAIVRENS